MIPVSRRFEAMLQEHANSWELTLSACIEMLVRADQRLIPSLDSISELILQSLLLDHEKSSSDFSYIEIDPRIEKQILVWSLAEHISEETYIRRRLRRRLKACASNFAR